MGASDSAIKRAYRDLAKLNHPDVGGDPDVFQRIAKAYEALTDPIAKENYAKYGNPDGPKRLEISIGLPTWLQQGFTGYLFLALYMGVLIGLTPILMCWCYRKNRHTDSSTGLNQVTVEWLQQRLYRASQITTLKHMPEIYGGCKDFQVLPAAPGDDELLRGMAQALMKEGLWNGGITKFNDKTMGWYVEPQAVIRTIVLLLAHANRGRLAAVAYSSPTLEAATKRILSKVSIITEMMVGSSVQMEAAYEQQYNGAADKRKAPPPIRYFDVIANVIKFSQMVRQGV